MVMTRKEAKALTAQLAEKGTGEMRSSRGGRWRCSIASGAARRKEEIGRDEMMRLLGLGGWAVNDVVGGSRLETVEEQQQQ